MKTVIIITGPTASGKTDLAIEVAKHFNTSIISADSRQCFKELNIGVAKPSAAQLASIHHWFISSHSVVETVNAALFESLALQWTDEIFKSRDVVVMSGGTGLYIKAFREGLDEIPAIAEGIRNQIIESYQLHGLEWLRETVQKSDPDFFSSGEILNPQRLMRALEVFQSTGRSILSFRNKIKKIRPFRMLEFAMQTERKELYQRINHRVDTMIENGLIHEVKTLQSVQHLNALQTVGYTELFDYLNGKVTREAAIEAIKQNTRHYAKRQLTWLNQNKDLFWLKKNSVDQILENY